MHTVLSACPTLLIPIVIVGSILGGFANPTEAAAVGAVAAVLVGRYVTQGIPVLADAADPAEAPAIYSAVVLFLVAAAAVFSWLLIYGKVPQATAAWIQTVAKDPVSFLLLTNVILLVIGTVIDGIPGLIMTVPILLPIATEVYDIDPRHFGVVVVINLVLGLMSPPVGLSFFVAAAVTGAKPGKMFIVTLPFFVISLRGAGAAVAVPEPVARPARSSPNPSPSTQPENSHDPLPPPIRPAPPPAPLAARRRSSPVLRAAGQGIPHRPDHAGRPFVEPRRAGVRRGAQEGEPTAA